MHRPKKHSHAYSMEWNEDSCVCTECGQEWLMTRKGWQPIPKGYGSMQRTAMEESDPYAFFESRRM